MNIILILMIHLIGIVRRLSKKLNKYWIACIVFIIVTFLMGDSTLFKRIDYSWQIFHLKREIELNKKQKKENLQKLKALRSDKEGLEKLAREQYLMTKPNEELFLIRHK